MLRSRVAVMSLGYQADAASEFALALLRHSMMKSNMRMTTGPASELFYGSNILTQHQPVQPGKTKDVEERVRG